jgi:hypothetical protein
MTSNITALKKIKKTNKPYHCQDVMGQHYFLMRGSDDVEIEGGAFFGGSGISCCAVGSKCLLIVNRTFFIGLSYRNCRSDK